MANRLKLHQILVDILGSNNVYFQPPETIKLKYPCIIYNLVGVNSKYADNTAYIARDKYTVTVIDRNPDSDIFRKLLNVQGTAFDRQFTTSNLYHTVVTMYI